MTEAEIREIYASKLEEGAPNQGIQVSTRRQEKGLSIQRLQEKISPTNIFSLAQWNWFWPSEIWKL